MSKQVVVGDRAAFMEFASSVRGVNREVREHGAREQVTYTFSTRPASSGGREYVAQLSHTAAELSALRVVLAAQARMQADGGGLTASGALRRRPPKAMTVDQLAELWAAERVLKQGARRREHERLHDAGLLAPRAACAQCRGGVAA